MDGVAETAGLDGDGVGWPGGMLRGTGGIALPIVRLSTGACPCRMGAQPASTTRPSNRQAPTREPGNRGCPEALPGKDGRICK